MYRRGREILSLTFDRAVSERVLICCSLWFKNPHDARPALIVSNDIANRELNRLQVVPLTSNVGRLYPAEAYVTLGGEQRKAMADQLSTIGKLRLCDRLGKLGHADMDAGEKAICLQLGLRKDKAV